MKALAALAILPLLCSCGNSKPESVEGPRAAIDEIKTVPAGADWNRQIMARHEGDMRYYIETPTKFSLTIVTEKGFQAITKRKKEDFSRSDVLLTKDYDPPSLDGTTHVPAGGSYWFIITNNSDKAQEVHLVVWDPGEPGKTAQDK